MIIVPNGRLHDLNFETLVVTGATPHYWIEDVTIAIAPSLAVLKRRGGWQAPRSRDCFCSATRSPPTRIIRP